MGINFLSIRNGVTFGNQASVPSNPVNGDLYYDSTRNTFVHYNNGGWKDLQSRSDVATAGSLTSANFPTTIVQSSLVRLTGSTSGTISGFAAMPDAKTFVLYNESTAAVTLSYNSLSEATAANRIITPTQGDLVVLSGHSVTLAYDSSQARWVVINTQSSSSGFGISNDLDSLTFRAEFIETFTENDTSSQSAVNGGAGFTNAVYNSSKQMYTMLYDASKTMNASGTAATLSGTPSFTVAAGDVVINLATGEVKRITALSSQTAYTLESAFGSSLVAQAVCVSQAVHTVDIYNYVDAGVSIATAFPGSTFSEIMVDYEDNATSGSNLWTPDTAPFVAFTASTDNTNWTLLQVRATNETDIMQSDICPTAGTSLYLRFFSDKTSGSGFVNLISYNAFMQKLIGNQVGAGQTGITWSAYALSNSSTTPINCTLSVIGGKTTITFTNSLQYAVGVNPGQSYGVLDVYLNGQMLPRFVAGSVPTTDGYYTELSGSVIQLDRDYSSVALEIQVLLRTQIVDTSGVNATNVNEIQNFIDDGFQPFIALTDFTLAATSTTGTPAVGTFYSSIQNRASMTDLSQDLKPRMGVERKPIQNLYSITTEYGPNNETIWGVFNDTLGQVRLGGSAWTPFTNVNGNIGASANGVGVFSSNIGDFIEITFYGTGLNFLLYLTNSARSFTVSVDGGATTTVSPSTTSTSTLLGGRNYNQNVVTNMVRNLTLGVHTVKVALSVGTDIDITGYEILNESANVITPSGIGYSSGQQLVAGAKSTLAYNSVVTGTRGGRVLIYQNAAGAVSQAFTPTNGSQLNYPSVTHINEEVVRVYAFREFGAGRADDFSRTNGSTQNATFTLEDGTTTVVGQNNFFNFNGINGQEGLVQNASGDFTTITFVGTGLDIITAGNSVGTVTEVYSILVDGTTIASGLTGAVLTANSITPIVSGLPYGTHTVKILVTATNSNAWHMKGFQVYQPKTPTLPTNCVALGTYNVMANYVANSTQSSVNIATGVLRKVSMRECNLTGTWVFSGGAAVIPLSIMGWELSSPASASTITFQFFGTGFEYRAYNNTAATTYTMSVDGQVNTQVANGSPTGGAGWTSALTTSFYGTSFTYANTTGVVTLAAAAGNSGCGISINGLTLGMHTITISWTSGTGSINPEAFDIITPIHSYKSNLYADLQNALPVGSNSISDDRVFTPIANLPATKAWAQAIGITGGPTTTSTTLTPMPDMSVSIKTSGGALDISYCATTSASGGAGDAVQTQIFVDGVGQGSVKSNSVGTATSTNTDRLFVDVSPGYHKVDVYWSVGSGTATAGASQRNLTVKET